MIITIITWIATALSILGNVYVASIIQKQQTIGYSVWIVSNFIWIAYFVATAQYSAMTLFVAYLVIAVYAVYKRVRPEKNTWDTHDTFWLE